jgi:hypothetical protein
MMSTKYLWLFLSLFFLSGCSQSGNVSTETAPSDKAISFYRPNETSSYYEDTYCFNPSEEISYHFAFPLVTNGKVSSVKSFHLNDGTGKPIVGYSGLSLIHGNKFQNYYYSYLEMNLLPSYFSSTNLNVSNVSLVLTANVSGDYYQYEVSLPVSLTFKKSDSYHFEPVRSSCLVSFGCPNPETYTYSFRWSPLTTADLFFVGQPLAVDKTVTALAATYQLNNTNQTVPSQGVFLSEENQVFSLTVTRTNASSLHGAGFYLTGIGSDGMRTLIPAYVPRTGDDILISPFLSDVVRMGYFSIKESGTNLFWEPVSL